MYTYVASRWSDDVFQLLKKLRKHLTTNLRIKRFGNWKREKRRKARPTLGKYQFINKNLKRILTTLMNTLIKKVTLQLGKTISFISSSTQ
jgi:hypothetical protein